MTEAMGMVLSGIPRLRAAVRFADEQGAEAIERVSRRDRGRQVELDGRSPGRGRALARTGPGSRDARRQCLRGGLSDGPDGSGEECDAGHEAQPDPEKVAACKAEMERVCARFQETRLTLLAEHGKPEGAPPGWSYIAGDPDPLRTRRVINKGHVTEGLAHRCWSWMGLGRGSRAGHTEGPEAIPA